MSKRRGAAIIFAHKNTISAIDTILEVCSELREELEKYEKSKNITKTVGTSIGTAGAITGAIGIGLALFTGGASLLLTAGAIGATATGASLNMSMDIADHFKTKEFLKRINKLVSDYQKHLKILDEIWKELDRDVKALMKTYDISPINATLVILRDGAIGVGKSALNVTRGTQAMQAAYVINTLKAAGTLTPSVTGGLKFTLAGAELTAKQSQAIGNLVVSNVTKFGASTTKCVLSGLGAVAGIALSAWEITNLVKDWETDHPTIQAIDRVMLELKNKKKTLLRTISDLEDATKTSLNQ